MKFLSFSLLILQLSVKVAVLTEAGVWPRIDVHVLMVTGPQCERGNFKNAYRRKDVLVAKAMIDFNKHLASCSCSVNFVEF